MLKPDKNPCPKCGLTVATALHGYGRPHEVVLDMQALVYQPVEVAEGEKQRVEFVAQYFVEHRFVCTGQRVEKPLPITPSEQADITPTIGGINEDLTRINSKNYRPCPKCGKKAYLWHNDDVCEYCVPPIKEPSRPLVSTAHIPTDRDYKIKAAGE